MFAVVSLYFILYGSAHRQNDRDTLVERRGRGKAHRGALRVEIKIREEA